VSRWKPRHRLAVLLLVAAVLQPLALLLLRDRPHAEAEALVITQRLDMSLKALPRYGQAVFGDGQVAEAVAAQVGDAGPEEVVPDRVALKVEPDSIVMRVVGRAEDPQQAADIANAAAAVFVEDLNRPGVGVGAFAVQSSATPSATPDDSGLGALAVVVAVTYAAAGLGLLAERPRATPAPLDSAAS
jgi:capsular polysaccharide biosynthesis protein